MGYSYPYIPGDRIVDCDVCGFTYRFSEIRKGVVGRQKGINVCPECFDPVDLKPATNIRKEGVLPEIK